MEVSEQVKAGIAYIQSLMKPGQVMTIVFEPHVSTGIIDGDDPELFKVVANGMNPIGKMMEAIFQNVCTDCMKDDYNFKNPFFVDLIEAYFHALVVNYGELVPITRTMAKVIFEHKLTNYKVVYASETHNMHFTVESSDSVIFDTERAYYLKVNT